MQRDHTQFICDISELSGLFEDARSLEAFLRKIVEMTAQHMHADVCSIYIYYEENQELVLKATKGLNPDSIGKVRLKLGEGLTGLALKELRPICERNASQSPNFRHFPGIGEEQYESFLAVPILRGRTRIGVMVLQNSKKNYFSDQDIKAFRAVTSQLANTIETAKLLMSFDRQGKKEKPAAREEKIKLIKGKVGSEGFAFATAVILREDDWQRMVSDEKQKTYTLEDFRQAVRSTEKELEELQKQIEEKLSDVASLIFTAQILMLKDQAFIEAITGAIEQGVAPPQAVLSVVRDYVRRFEGMPNVYLREKAHDVKDIGKRLLSNLLGGRARFNLPNGHIVVAEELLPSDALKFSSQNVKGIILLSGGVTSHLSILARSLDIPLVIAENPRLLELPPKTPVLLDAEQGNIYIDPSSEVIASFRRKEAERLKTLCLRGQVADQTHTKDGTRVKLLSNINLLGDLKAAQEVKAEGIGLYRSEFPFIVRSDFPTEEEQYVIYRKLVENMKGKEITFRTLDIGGDKVLSYFHHTKEENPFLGMRSIRFSLRHKDVFAQQIRAILRAGVNADIKIMFPMISSLDEFLEAKKVVTQCLRALKAEKVPHHPRPSVGMMVELPAVMEIIDELAEAVDFFSIGTNDFVQYMLAVDRTNEKVADFYLPHHPSILRAFNKIVQAAIARDREVSICGDMAREEKFLPYFLGIGIRRISVEPTYLPKIQKAIGRIDLKEAQATTVMILAKSRVSETAKIVAL
jgi:phosphotransferase system enzyme I (PtsP)